MDNVLPGKINHEDPRCRFSMSSVEASGSAEVEKTIFFSSGVEQEEPTTANGLEGWNRQDNQQFSSQLQICTESPFTMRSFVLAVRHKDIKKTWPFPQKHLQRWLDKGREPVLPPLQSPRKVADATVAATPIQDNDLEIQVCQGQTRSLKMGHDQHAKHAEKTSEPIQIIKGYSPHRKDLGFGCQTKRIFHKILRKTRSHKLKPEILPTKKIDHEKKIEEKDNLLQTSLACGDLTAGFKSNDGMPGHCESGDSAQAVEPVADEKIDEKEGPSQDIRTEDAPASEPTRFVPKLGPSRKHMSKSHKLRIADGLKIKHVSNKSTKEGVEILGDGSIHENSQSQEMGDLNGTAAANFNTKNNRRLEDILRGEGQLMEDLHANRTVSEIAAKDLEECCEQRELSNGEIKANHIEIAKRANECGIGLSENLVPKVCPVCLSFSSTSNTALNAHIDHCLTAEPAPNRVPVKSPKYRMRTQKIRSIADICGTPPSKDQVDKCASVDPLLTRKQINPQKLKLVIEKRHGIVKTCHLEAYSGRKHETSNVDHEDKSRKEIQEPSGGKEKPKKCMRLDHIEQRHLTEVPSQQRLTLNFKPRHAMTLKIGEVNMVDKNTRDLASEQNLPSTAPIILKKRRCGSRKKKDVSKIILAMQAVGTAEQKFCLGNLDLSDANEDKCASVLTNSNCTSSLDSSCSMLGYKSSENYSGSGSLHEAWLPPKGILKRMPLTGKNADLEDIQSAQRRAHGKGILKTRSMGSRQVRDAINPKDHHKKTNAVMQKQNSSSKHIATKDRIPPAVPVSKRKFTSRVNDQSLETPPKKYKASFPEKLCRLDNWKNQSELCIDGNTCLPSKKRNAVNVDDLSSDNHSSSSNIHRSTLHGQVHTNAATIISGAPERSKASRKSAPLPRGPGGRFISVNGSASLADLKSSKKGSARTLKVKSGLHSPPSVLVNDLRSFSCDDNQENKDESESDQEKGVPSSDDLRENGTGTFFKGCSNDEVVQSSIHPGSLVQGTPITCRALSATPSMLPDESGASRLTVREEQVDKSNANGDSMSKNKVTSELTQRTSGILSREILEQQLGMNHSVDKSLWQRQGAYASSSESFMCGQVNGNVGKDFEPWSINGPFQNESAIDYHRQNEMITSNSTMESSFHASTLPGWMRTAVCEQPGSSGILYNELHGNERCYLEGCMQSKTTSDIYDSDKPILRLMGKNVLLSPRGQTPSHMIQRNRGPEEVFPNSYKFSELLLDSTSDFPYATREPRSRQFVQNDQNPQSSVVYSQTVREADLADIMSSAENTNGSAAPTIFKSADLKFQGDTDGGTLSTIQKPKHVDAEVPPSIFFSEPVKEYPRSSGWYAVDEQSLLQKSVEASTTYSYQSVKNMPENLPSFVVSNRPAPQCSNFSFTVESQNAESQLAAMKEYGSRNFQLLNGTYDGMDVTRLSRNFPSHNTELHSHYIQPERVAIRGQNDAMIERRQAYMASQSQCLSTIREDPFNYVRSHAEVMASTINGSVSNAKLTGLAMLPSLGNYNLLSSHNF